MEIIILHSSTKCPAAEYILAQFFLALLDPFVFGGERRERREERRDSDRFDHSSLHHLPVLL